MPTHPDRPRVIPAVVPDDVTLGEVYRLTLQLAEDVAFVRGRVEAMGDLEPRIASLETFRSGVRRTALATFIAIIPIAAAITAVATNGA